jgi:glycerol uptake facilitator-like aquaporin
MLPIYGSDIPWCPAACWFIASTSFANPAVTLAASDTFAGTGPQDTPAFIMAQPAGAFAAAAVFRRLVPNLPERVEVVAVIRGNQSDGPATG